MFDILCIGSANLDAFLTLLDENDHVSLDTANNKLCVTYGEKIEVEKCDFLLGGNACNTAVGLSRLGLKTALCAEIGDDEFSQKILNGLKKENINTTLVKQTLNKNASFSIALNFKNERTLFVEHVKREHNFDFDNLSPKLVYLTSLGEVWEKAYLKTLEFVEKNNLLLAFNPGNRQIHKIQDVILSVFSKTDYLFINKDEAEEILYGRNIPQAPDDNNYFKKLLLEIAKLGPKTIIITDGKNGSFALDKNIIYKQETIEVKIVEKTGAGDAYTGGFLAAIISGLQIEEAMKWATLEAISVIQKIGAQNGLLTKDQILKKLAENSSLVTQKI